MTDDVFAELVRAHLHSAICSVENVRLLLALRDVVNACGEAGEAALRSHCFRLATTLEKQRLAAQKR